MVFRLFNPAFCLAAVMIFAGCQRPAVQDTTDVLAREPNIEDISVADDYAARAVGAAGGYKAWMQTTKLQLDCVVTFYKPDADFYLTEQHHQIYPWSDSVRISAIEPQGKFLWQLSADKFDVSGPSGRISALPEGISNRDFAEAILYITTAPVRFLDKSVEFNRLSGPVKMEGRWYYPIERVISEQIGVKTYWSKVIFYQNQADSLVDMIWFVDEKQHKFLAVRGYDYHQAEAFGVLVPARIEIFKTDSLGLLRHRLVKIDY